MPHSLKSKLRAQFRQLRDKLSEEARALASAACCARILRIVRAAASGPICLAGYSAINSEMDVWPALASLRTNHTIALPAVLAHSRMLEFRPAFARPLVPGIYGISEPPPVESPLLPDILLLPLLAFDRTGHRLGYGAGYYDHTLAALRGQKPVLAIGVAYGVQESAPLPAGAHDERLDMIVTEAEIILV